LLQVLQLNQYPDGRLRSGSDYWSLTRNFRVCCWGARSETGPIGPVFILGLDASYPWRDMSLSHPKQKKEVAFRKRRKNFFHQSKDGKSLIDPLTRGKRTHKSIKKNRVFDHNE
jgi:hypothetical protein